MKCLNKFNSLKPIYKYSIIISSIILLLIIIIIIIVVSLSSKLTGTNKGAYLKTPDASKLEYRLGNGIGLFESSWSIDNVRNLMQYAGLDGMRKKLPEAHFEAWGYGIELGVCEINEKHGILDVVGYLCTPSQIHSSNATNNKELCYPDHLYEPIWLDDGNVNPNNYWANYVYKTVTTYKNYIKIWEAWNEPDYVNSRVVDTSPWATSPPDPKTLLHWYGSIFQYIRLLRITYEVAKKVDPECWVATGGLGYPNFLDSIMRYTDNPDNGKLTKEYPAYGGAYFDCDAYHKYPNWGSEDMETGETFNDNGSDSHAKKVVTLKKNHHYIIKKYGFGDKYPEKIFVATETGLDSGEGGVGGNLVRRNWIIKLALYALEYDVRQIHMLILEDGGGGSGDYENIGKFETIEKGYAHLKSSSKGRQILKKMNLGKYVFDEKKTKKFRESLPENMSGIVLKRKFPKVEGEEYYYEYMYSVWLTCIKNEVEGEIQTKLDIPFDPLKLDWEGNKENMESDSTFKITSTPIFLLGNEGISGWAIFFIVLGSIIFLILLMFVGLYIYKRFIKKENIPLDKNLVSSLIKSEKNVVLN